MIFFALILYCVCPCTVAVIRGKVHRRVGEAKNPGPEPWQSLDDSQAEPWEDEPAADGDYDIDVLPALVDDHDCDDAAEIVDDHPDDPDSDSDSGAPDWVKTTWTRAEKLVGLVTRDTPAVSRDPLPKRVRIPPGAPSFPTKVFGGSVDGYLFTTRKGVTGYYRDEPPPKRILSLDHLVAPSAPGTFEATERAPASHAFRRDGKRFRGKGRRAKAALAPSDCSAIKEGVTTLSDGQFRECGLWALDTINPNSWSAARDRILSRVAADFAFLQETREHTDAAIEKLKREARDLGWSAVASPAWRTAAGKGLRRLCRSCGQGNRHRTSPRAADQRGPEAQNCCQLGIRHVQGGVHLVSVYPKDGVGLNEDNMHLLQELAALLRQIKGPWIIAADWNLAPTTLAESKWPEMVKGVVVATERATCFSSTYDYFVVSEGLSSAIAGIARIEDAALYPHYPVRLFIECNARRHLTRQLAKPTRVPGSLPHGPLPQPVNHHALYPQSVDDSSVDDAARRWMEAARGEWASLTSTTPDFSEPRFHWKPAVGPKAEAYAGASAQSQWWRLSARRADECATLLLRHGPAAGRSIKGIAEKAVVSAHYAGFDSADADGINGWLQAVTVSITNADALSLRRLSAAAAKNASRLESRTAAKRLADWRAALVRPSPGAKICEPPRRSSRSSGSRAMLDGPNRRRGTRIATTTSSSSRRWRTRCRPTPLT